MQRFLQLTLDNGTVIYNTNPIENWLYTSPYYWILKCEVDNVKLTIKDDILYWNNGIFYYGNWKWGVFENGEFRSGIWNGGIFLNGTFKGKWLNGVFKNGTFKGEKIKGQFPKDKI